MEHVARRSMFTVASLVTVGSLALAPVTVAPPALPEPTISATRISTEAVQLTDAWSELVNNTLQNVDVLAALFVGSNTTFPLPNPTIFVAPIITQLVLNPLIYTVQLITGQGGKIPAEISTHISQVLSVTQVVVTQLPPLIGPQIQAPFTAIRLALESIATSSNPLLGLAEAPAVFLDNAINSEFGLLGDKGPVAISLLIRNLFATALATPLPAVALPFKKAGGVAVKARTPKAATVAPSGVAGSARTKAPSATSAKKAGAAKTGTARNGVGRGKR